MRFDWGTETSYEQRFRFTNNQWQNKLPKVRKSRRTGQDQKMLITAFALVLTATEKKIVGDTEQWLVSPTHCEFVFCRFLIS